MHKKILESIKYYFSTYVYRLGTWDRRGIQRRKTVDDGFSLIFIINLERHERTFRTHKFVPSECGTFGSTPRTAHHVQRQRARRRDADLFAGIVCGCKKIIPQREYTVHIIIYLFYYNNLRGNN